MSLNNIPLYHFLLAQITGTLGLEPVLSIDRKFSPYFISRELMLKEYMNQVWIAVVPV